MTLKVDAFTIDDADLEAGFAASAQAHLDATGEVLTPETVAASAFEAYRGTVKRALQAKVEQLPAEAVAEVAALVDTKIPAKLDVADAQVDPIAEVKR